MKGIGVWYNSTSLCFILFDVVIQDVRHSISHIMNIRDEDIVQDP